MARSYAVPEVLVSTDWAVAHLEDPALRFVEVDLDNSAYERGHLAGAVGFDWQLQLNAPVRRDIPPPSQFERLLASAGIANDTGIVLYGDSNNWFAAYAFWQYYGHDDVRLIDGGRKKLLAEDRPMSSDVPAHAPTAYRIGSRHPELRAMLTSVQEAVANGRERFVDVRSPAEFSGEIIAPPGMTETAQRGGHIPSAVNVPWNHAVNADGTFKPFDELAKLYADHGIDGSKPTIAYCRIGERSSHTWFVLKYLLGLADVRNYDGSWTEYGNLIDVPIDKDAKTRTVF